MSVVDIVTSIGKHRIHPGDPIPPTTFQWHVSVQTNVDRIGIARTMLKLHILCLHVIH